MIDFILSLTSTVGVAYLFYRSIFGLFIGVVIIPYVLAQRKKKHKKQYERTLGNQFWVALEAVAGALSAGYSVEMAWVEAQKELKKVYGKEAPITGAFEQMNKHVQMNEPLERVLLQYASSTGIADICNFAEMFRYVKRNGGDMTAMIRTTLKRMVEKDEVLEDIQTAITAKQMEQRMLSALVPGILFFVTVSSGSYMEALYHNVAGIIVMSSCLGGYLAATWWAEKIIAIEV